MLFGPGQGIPESPPHGEMEPHAATTVIIIIYRRANRFNLIPHMHSVVSPDYWHTQIDRLRVLVVLLSIVNSKAMNGQWWQ